MNNKDQVIAASETLGVFLKLFRALRIRQLLLLMFFVLASIAICAVGWNVVQVFRWNESVSRLVDANAIGQSALSLTAQLGVERGLTATFLSNPQYFHAAAQQRLQTVRKNTDTNLEQLRLELERTPDLFSSLIKEKLNNKVNGAIQALRLQVDQNLLEQNGGIDYLQWIDELTKCIEEVADINRIIRAPREESEHATRYGSYVKQLFFLFSESLGGERALLSAVIAMQRPLSVAEFRKLDELKYAQREIMKEINNILEYFPKTPAINEARQALRTYYKGQYQMLRLKVLESSRKEGAYPVDATDWFDRATQGVESILQLAAAVDRHIDEDVMLIKSRNRSQLFAGMAIVVLVMVVFIAALLVTYYRILNPLKRLQRSATVIGQGDFSQTLQVSAQDELGEVASAFEVMRSYLLVDRELRQKAEQELRKLMTAIEQSFSALVISDINGIIEYANPRFYQVSGYSADEVVGSHVSITRPLDIPSARYDELWQRMRQGRVWQGELQRKRKNGELYWDMCSMSPVRDRQGNVTHVINIHHEITEQKVMADRLNFLTYHDELTELPSKALLADHFEQGVVHAQTGGKVALLVLGLDRFKLVNESLGFQVGDRLLIAVARRLSEFARSCDTLARYGGDKFVLLVDNVESIELLSEMVRRLLAIFEQPFIVDQHELHITVSVGGSVWPEDGQEVETLLRKADTAMYQAKTSSDVQFHLFTDEMNRQLSQQLQMENDLRKGLEEQQFELYFQPQINMSSGELEGAEALIRWNHPKLGLVPPMDFIFVAEHTGFIRPLGRWILEQACMTLAGWSAAGFDKLSIAVNVSVCQLEDHDFVAHLSKIVQESNCSPSSLEIEITESVVMGQPEKMFEVLKSIKDIGVRLALDDFGTGYSSLSYLRRFPFDKLKIDRSFIKDIVTKPEDAIIARAITEMAHSLNITVLAEGVETQIQSDYVRRCACDQMQGFLISRPVPVGEFERLYNLT